MRGENWYACLSKNGLLAVVVLVLLSQNQQSINNQLIIKVKYNAVFVKNQMCIF
jgi:hypothetical protein